MLIFGTNGDVGHPSLAARQAIEFGTVNDVGNDRIVPFVVANSTLVPAGITLPRASLIVTTTGSSVGVKTMLGVQVPKGTLVRLGVIDAEDPENNTASRPRTWMLRIWVPVTGSLAHEFCALLLAPKVSSQLTPSNRPFGLL
jgi:hypothetical protein